MKLPVALLQQIARHLADLDTLDATNASKSGATQTMPALIADRVPILAVSGGRDSMLLLHCFAQYYASYQKSAKQEQDRSVSTATDALRGARIKKTDSMALAAWST